MYQQKAHVRANREKDTTRVMLIVHCDGSGCHNTQRTESLTNQSQLLQRYLQLLQYATPVFFNRGYAEPRGSADLFQGFRDVPGKKSKNNLGKRKKPRQITRLKCGNSQPLTCANLDFLPWLRSNTRSENDCYPLKKNFECVSVQNSSKN